MQALGRPGAADVTGHFWNSCDTERLSEQQAPFENTASKKCVDFCNSTEDLQLFADGARREKKEIGFPNREPSSRAGTSTFPSAAPS